jgi:phage shock protein C
MIAGVVSGLANYFDLDVTLARVLYVAISVCSAAFPGVLVYVLLWILMPQDAGSTQGSADEIKVE